MALYKTIILSLVLQVERKGEASEKWAIWPSSRLPHYPCAAGRKERRACCAVGNMTLYKTTILTLVLQVERKGEPAEQWTIWPSTRLPY
jgi:hypothetical protein